MVKSSAWRFEWVQGVVKISSISIVNCSLVLNVLMRKSSEHAAAAAACCRDIIRNVPKKTVVPEESFPFHKFLRIKGN